VLAHARALLTGVRGETAHLDADIRDTATVLDAAARTLDFSQPVALMMIAVLHCVEPGLVRAPEWRPDSAADTANPAEMWSGVARKP
jgi:hypothetical protein